jgi:phosphoglycolate phosphatase
MKPILLFDIDGTLLKVKRDFLLGVIEVILDEMALPGKQVISTSFAGRTDRDIFEELAAKSGSDELYFDLKEFYVKQMLTNLSAHDIDLIPGAEEAVLYAEKSGLAAGLCTGNFREVAYKKVEAAGLQGLFSFGGFGCNHADRIHLPGEAHDEYSRFHGQNPSPSDYVVIGDTPNDIRCAKYFGARSVGVTTGGYNRSKLEPSGPDLLLDSLASPHEWINQL